MRIHRTILVAATAALALAAPAARGDVPPEATLDKVGFDQNLDAQLPLDLAFRDETGRAVTLGDYFKGRPVVLTLVYYRCPMLCGEELKGLARGLKPVPLEIGKDFEVVTVSIDPSETPELAAKKKANVLEFYGRPEAAAGWHFLTGDLPAIQALARTVGFRYTYSESARQYLHAAGLVVATPTGKLARYFYGIEFSPKDLQFGLIESSKGKIGSPISRLLLFCFHYDPSTGKYSLAIVNLLRVFGTATALGLAGYVVAMLRRDRRTPRRSGPTAAQPMAN